MERLRRKDDEQIKVFKISALIDHHCQLTMSLKAWYLFWCFVFDSIFFWQLDNTQTTELVDNVGNTEDSDVVNIIMHSKHVRLVFCLGHTTTTYKLNQKTMPVSLPITTDDTIQLGD